MDQVGRSILRITRDTDKKARIDEKTFAMLFPETPIENLPIVFKKVSTAFENVKIENKGRIEKYKPAIRVGFAGFPQDGDTTTALREKALKLLKET
jgi:GGDEF domain-containing protein